MSRFAALSFNPKGVAGTPSLCELLRLLAVPVAICRLHPPLRSGLRLATAPSRHSAASARTGTTCPAPRRENVEGEEEMTRSDFVTIRTTVSTEDDGKRAG